MTILHFHIMEFSVCYLNTHFPYMELLSLINQSILQLSMGNVQWVAWHVSMLTGH